MKHPILNLLHTWLFKQKCVLTIKKLQVWKKWTFKYQHVHFDSQTKILFWQIADFLLDFFQDSMFDLRLIAYFSNLVFFNRELASAVLRVYLLGICQQVFQLDIWFKRVPKAHRGIPKHPKVSHSIPKF